MPLFRDSSMVIGEQVVNSTTGSILFSDASTLLGQDNSNLFWDDSNNRLGIGTSSPVSKLEIMNGSSSEISLTVQGAASQSGNLADFLNSSGDRLLSVNANGYVVFQADNLTISGGALATFMSKTGTTTFSGSGSGIAGFQSSGEFHWQAPAILGVLPGTFFQFQSTLRFSGTFATNFGFVAYANQAAYIADGATIASSTTLFGHYSDTPTYSIANSGSWGSSTAVGISYSSDATYNAGVAWGTRVGFQVRNATGAGTLSTQIGLDVASLTKGSTNYAIRTGASGEIRFGNRITLYNNIATVSNGVPSELATVDLTTQSAAISATTIYTPTATGMFRLSFYLQVTRAATSSSILGGATGIVITYNDGAGNVAQSVTLLGQTQAGVAASVNSGNTTASSLAASIVINARTGVAIQYAIGYTSVGATTMQYSVSAKVEAM